jgi:two-component system OmpR family sensor kinase
MNDLVEDLLLLASLDQGRPLAREPVDLGDVLRDAADDGRAVQRERTIAVSVAEDDDLVVLGDDARLRQVVAALTHNALVHTPGTASIRLAGHLEGETALISVVDDGPGMSPSRADHVFDRFYRGDASRSRHQGGSGLGLPIARSIVEAHDGTIWLDTAPSAGCAFRVRLPVRRPGASSSTA